MELRQEEQIIWQGNERLRGYNKIYYRTLGEAFIDCPDLMKEMGSVDLNARDLTGIVASYHQCIGAPYEKYNDQKAKARNRIDIGLLAGMKHVDFGPSNDGQQGEITSSPGYSFGLHTEFFFGGSRQNLSLQMELIYSAYKASREEYQNGIYHYPAENMDRKNLHLPVLFNYYLRTRRSGYNFGAGIDLGEGFALQAGYEFKVRQKSALKLNLRVVPLLGKEIIYFVNIVYAVSPRK